MTKEFWFEKINSKVTRLSIGVFDIESDEVLFNKIVNFILPKSRQVFLFGLRENFFWKSENYILNIRKEIKSDFDSDGYYRIIHQKDEGPLFAMAKINSFDLNKIHLLNEFWNYFEIVFIIRACNDESISTLSKNKNFLFKQYEELLNSEEIEISICKTENDVLSIDSKNYAMLQELETKLKM